MRKDTRKSDNVTCTPFEWDPLVAWPILFQESNVNRVNASYPSGPFSDSLPNDSYKCSFRLARFQHYAVFLTPFSWDQSVDPGVDFYAVRAFHRCVEATASCAAELWRDAFGSRGASRAAVGDMVLRPSGFIEKNLPHKNPSLHVHRRPFFHFGSRKIVFPVVPD